MIMIDSYSFGRITVRGKTYTSDVIIYPDRVDDSWWRKEGHNLSPEDLEDILQFKPDVLVIGTGSYGVMRVPENLKKAIRDRSIKLFVDKTGNVVEIYNQLEKKEKVVAALHLTC